MSTMTSTHVPIEPRVLYVGTPIALVTTMSPDGSCNIGPMSSVWALGRTMVLGWAAASQTLANLERERQCVINFRIVETYVRRIHADRAILRDSTMRANHIDTDAWAPALYVFRDYFGTGHRLGRTRRR